MRIIALALTRTESAPWLPLLPGVVRAQYLAGRLYQLPLGVLAISIATTVFPLMSRFSALGDLPSMRDTINRALRLCLFLSIPAGVGLIIIAHPTIVLGFQRDKFGPLDSEMTSVMLQMYSIGLPAYFCSHILLRAFFARQDTRTPMYSAIVCTVLSLLLVYVGIYSPLRSASLGLATAVTAIINVFWLLWVLHLKIGKLGMRSLLASTARTAAATAAMAAVMLASQWIIRWGAAAYLPGRTRIALLVELVAAIVLGTAVFFLAARTLGCRELGELRGRRSKMQNAA
jgi:putative peptidoglycan lipid II flippase